MSAIEIESIRLLVQNKLDAAKTPAQRNKLGQFATSTALATGILNSAKDLLPPSLTIRFLDPAFGTGSFYSALLRTFSSARIVGAVGYEIDADVIREANNLWSNSQLQLHAVDFTKSLPPVANDQKTNLLICNPPYVRHHHLSRDEKRSLQKTTRLLANVNLSGLSGLYCYFLCLSYAWMAEDGLAVWLIPSEFMDVNYGRQVKSFLLNQVTLLRIHRFNPEDVQFKEALVSSAVVWFKKAIAPAAHSVEFSYGGTLEKPEISKRLSMKTLRESAKWTRFPQQAEKRQKSKQPQTLSDFFTIKRGLATGANEFFLMTSARAAERDLPREFLRPILPSSRYLPVDEVLATEEGEPAIDRKLYLLICNLPEDKVRSNYPSLWKYLQAGIKRGIDQRYLCSHRSPWYSQEHRPPAPLLCTYMGRRDGGNRRPFRFILNHSHATAPNVYLMMYPKPDLQSRLVAAPSLLKRVWQQLNQLSLEDLLNEGRVYGGGLHKLEPKELGNVITSNLLN